MLMSVLTSVLFGRCAMVNLVFHIGHCIVLGCLDYNGESPTVLPIGSVSIPAGMVQDQFGMMGLLTFIRGAESDPNLVALALGRYI